MKIFSSKRRVAAAAALLLLALFLVRPGASRLKSRIISSLSAGVGRPVDIGSVHVHLLPRPGFDLENLVVYDDPAFGAEPMLRASEVTADLRLTSLLRGRLEVARLNLTEPSLNLVHSQSGRWNLEALLERTARMPLAPTGKAKSEPRPGFPYIEGTSARINFKSGFEKKPYALTNADFSLWQDSENAWGVRLKAQPFRGDLNLNDTGLLQVSGTWQRAMNLHDTPLQFQVEWSRAQLGQVTKFFTGKDKGWRGTIRFDGVLTGSPAKLQITSTASVEDFRRYDIANGPALSLAGRCDAEYTTVTQEFHQVVCTAPVGSGVLNLTGSMGLPGSGRYALAVTADKIPAAALAMLAQRAKKNLPDDLVVDGTLQAKFAMQADAAAGSKPRFDGRGEIADFQVSSASNKAELGPESIQFVLVNNSTNRAALGRALAGSNPGMQFPEGAHLEFGPFAIAAARAGAPTVRGWMNRSGYGVNVVGEGEITRTLRLARLAGVPALAVSAEGSAQVNLQITGSWAGQNGVGTGFSGPQVTGTAKLRNVRVPVPGAGGAVEILSAEMLWAPDAVHVGKLSAKAAGTNWTGSMQMPRGCGGPEACPVRFALNADEIALARLHDWASPATGKHPWYRMLEAKAQAGSPLLARLQASGHVTISRLLLHTVTATRVSTDISLDAGKLELSALEADFLGGKHHGKWLADFSIRPAACGGSGNLTGIALANLADAMKDRWIAGVANASYEVNGHCAADFWPSAEGTLKVEMRDGVLPHLLVREDAEPLRITRLTGQGRLRGGKIEISDTKLDSPEGKYELSGIASFQREIKLKMARMANGATTAGYAISGTLADPRITPLSGTEQARLKR
ncbi:MAG TPA: AsmA family protein [Candidatus Dormibacteraeota bacterium]|nr:AsmA family protein [Candidatus Dormibacteraeota bacterium]